MRTRSVAGLVILLGLALLLAHPAHARRVQVYEAQHRTAADLLPLAEVALGERGTATLYTATNSVVLVGDEDAVEEALALLRSQDRQPRTIVFHHRTEQMSALQASGAKVEWSARGGGVRIGNVRRPTSAPASIAIAAGGADGRARSSFGGTVRILEGTTGNIYTGQSVPVHTRGRRTVQTTIVTAQSGFEATPRILGDGRVQVRLLPIQSRIDPGGAVTFTRAATTVIASPGETVAIGGLAGSQAAQQSGGGFRSSAGDHSSVLLLTVDVEGEAR